MMEFDGYGLIPPDLPHNVVCHSTLYNKTKRSNSVTKHMQCAILSSVLIISLPNLSNYLLNSEDVQVMYNVKKCCDIQCY